MATSKDRERELARKRYERQQQRRAAQRQVRRTGAVIASVVVVLAVVGTMVALSLVGKSNHKKPASALSATSSTSPSASPSASPTPTPSPSHVAGCTDVPAPPAKPQQFAKAPAVTIDKTATYVATIRTNCGVVKAQLLASKAPVTVNSFAFLASKHFFDGTPCHRLTTSGIFVLQCGDPTGTGTGGPGYRFKDENLKGATYPAGTIAMANSGPGTNGSQFFIVYKDTNLPPNYTPFGKVTSGLDVIQKIAAAGSNNANGAGDGGPNQPVGIVSFTVTKAK